jgi:lipid-binding SYLF domain-containing protein
MAAIGALCLACAWCFSRFAHREVSWNWFDKIASRRVFCMFKVLMTGVLAVSMFAQSAKDKEDVVNRLAEATTVLTEMTDISDSGIPRELIDKSQCVIVIPSMKQGGFIFGGKFGRGFMSCRHSSGKGWTSPAAVRTEGGTFGLLAGGSATDIIMTVKSQRGAERLMGSKFTLGGEVSAAAGPVGRTSSAMTDAQMSAEILSWSRSRGVYAGLNLQGSTIREDGKANQVIYGKEMSTRTVLDSPGLKAPKADEFVGTLDKISPVKK